MNEEDLIEIAREARLGFFHRDDGSPLEALVTYTNFILEIIRNANELRTNIRTD